MNWIDWCITALPLLIVVIVGVRSRRYVRGVADFLSANRSAGRYLLCIAGSELQAGAVVFVALFEVFIHSGFALTWWNALAVPVLLLVQVTGFVYYRFRETRALTLAQFFEIRYNKSFRLFTGLLGFFAGLLNFGVIPAIGARVMVYFLGLPENVIILGHATPTYVPLMAAFLAITAFVALTGGVIAVMIISTLEGILSQIFYLVIIFTILALFSWPQMSAVLVNQSPGHSLLNPFQAADVPDFNLWYIVMSLGLRVYSTMAWQNTGGYNSAGLTPHEGRMANVLSNWREFGKIAVITMLALAALTYLHHPDFASGAADVRARVGQIADPQAREQMEAPIAMAQLLPTGVKGTLCAVLLMGIFCGDAIHLHSWGSIFVQDFLVPLRRRPFGPRVHLGLLRGSIIAVACFAFFFGTFFHMTDYINMWWSVTQGIFTGGAGAAIIGGLYWKKGTAEAAWAAFLTGSILTVGGIVAQQISAAEGLSFGLNGVEISFYASLIAIAVYIVVSLLTCREDFNLDRMLHRGIYALPSEPTVPAESLRLRWARLLGIDENFTRGDRWITGLLLAWSLFWFGIFVLGSIWNLLRPWSTETWSAYFHVVGVGLPVFFAVVTGIWFTWGGIRDTRALFQRLGREKVNPLDDGTVKNHRNFDEAPAAPSTATSAQ